MISGTGVNEQIALYLRPVYSKFLTFGKKATKLLKRLMIEKIVQGSVHSGMPLLTAASPTQETQLIGIVVPVVILCAARWLPCSVELRRVLVVQAAMPAAVVPIIIARHYGGQPLTAVQVVLSTTATGIFTCPLWIRAGLAFAGLA